MSHFSIIGRGFAGLSLAYFLSQAKAFVTVYCLPKNVDCASLVATGLLHPFCGKRAKASPRAKEGFTATLRLFQALPSSSFYLKRPIFRPALDNEQKKYFQQTVKENPSEVYWTSGVSESNYPGIIIKNGIQVEAPVYMETLEQACRTQGVRFVEREVRSRQDLDCPTDKIIWACGYGSTKHNHLHCLQLSPKKGQALHFILPKDEPMPAYNLNASKYIVFNKDYTGILGSTYERQFTMTKPCIETAKELIFPQASEAFPSIIEKVEIVGAKSGVRVNGPIQHLPISKQLNANEWALTGFGSRGLLYHALYAKELSELLLSKGA